jgi:hypothetical protein
MRIAWIELRRSNALAVALLLIGVSVAALATNLSYWHTQWTRFANDHASAVFVLLPIALAGGAMLGRRERRTRSDELLGSTARPRWQRVAPAVAAMAVAVVAAHVVVFAAGGLVVARFTGYTSVMSMLIPLADSVILIGGAWLGFAAGRTWPSPLVPPALAAAGLLAQLGLSLAEPPGELTRLDNLVLVVQPPSYDWETISGRALLGHLALGIGLAVAGFLLAATRRWAVRVIAVPVLAAAIVAAAMIPGVGLSGRYAVDAGAQRLVCSGPVCVTAVHQHTLKTAAPQVSRALTLLAKLPGAPQKAVEWRAATVYEPGGSGWGSVPVAPGTLEFVLDEDTGQAAPHLLEDIVWAAGAPTRNCREDDAVAEGAAGAWLLGADDITTDDLTPDPEFHAQMRDTVHQLRGAPEAEQVRRVAAVRDAAAACKTGLVPILTGKDHG